MKKYFFFISALIALTPSIARAALFDSADFIRKDNHAAGAFGDIVLNDPSGEGIEGRYKFGLEDYLNVEGIVGAGSDTRRFRLGAQANYNFLPDLSGQPGVSAIAGAMLLKRTLDGDHKTGVKFTVGPLLHKEVEGLNGLPMLLYLGVPWSLTLQSGTYVSSSQLDFGALTDITNNRSWFVSSEAGISLAKDESYIMIGVGTRFTPFEKATPVRNEKHRDSVREPRKVEPAKKGQSDEEEFRTEDFQR